MTKPNIPEIEKQLDGITPEPWQTTDDGRFFSLNILSNADNENEITIGEVTEENDAAFIASAPSTIRSLIAYIKELEAENGQHVAKILHLENNARKMIGERQKYDPNPNLTF